MTRTFSLLVGQDALGGVATLKETDGSTVNAWQNLWGSTYKDVGKKLFYASRKKPYKVFTVKGGTEEGAAIGLTDKMTLSLKVTSAGAVTATMSYDTGNTKKNTKTKKMEAVIYKPTCSTALIPTSAADAEPFTGAAFIYFAPSSANNFDGYAGYVGISQ